MSEETRGILARTAKTDDKTLNNLRTRFMVLREIITGEARPGRE